MKRDTRPMTEDEHNAVWAALRLLANEMDKGTVTRDDGGIGSILTCGGACDGLSADQISELADRLDSLELSLTGDAADLDMAA